jgi:hypothetical protein
MHRMSQLFPAVLLLVFMAGLWTGCPGSSSTTVALYTPYLTSHDGFIKYRIPAGWFDAAADSQSSGQTIWLLRDDYSATIAVSEVHIDADAREDLQMAGMMHLAQLTMALAAGGKPYVLQHPPEGVTIGGSRGVAYEIVIPAVNDVLRVIVVDTGVKLYMVTALVSGEATRGLRDEVFAAQDAFLSGLRW